LIASLVKGVEWMGGGGSVEVAVSGKITHPNVNGTVFLKDARINIDQIKSTVFGLNADVRARGNYFEIKRLSGVVNGQLTQGKSSPFSFAGYADLSRAFGRAKDGDMDLAMADSDINIEIPGLYSGGMLIKGARLKGKFYLGQEAGFGEKPLFTASVLLHDGSISVPRMHGTGQKQFSPMALNLVLDIGKSVNIVQGQGDSLISTDMSNLNIEITANGLTVKGGVLSPAIEGDVNIIKGSLSILSRDFSILSKAEQEKYFVSNPTLAQDNTAQFLGGAIYGAVPTINVTALSEVSVIPDAAAASTSLPTDNKPPQKQKVYIITKVSGMPGALEREKALSIVFYPFIEDTAGIPVQIVAAPYNESQVRIMLLPDFIKDMLGFSKGGSSGINANAILVDYANRKFQSIISNTVGSKIEQALGLESFSVSYNIGRDIEKLLPARRGDASADAPQLGIGFVKGFFGRIYIQMRYSQTIEQVNVLNPTSLNYQLTYKLSPFWSLVYYREPVTFQEQSSTYYKAMLQAVYKL
ncbi:MAG: translocation/assembly module TamB domain-containing protein, partial [Candidatus Margulisiibacteriota bacterium]